MGILIVESYKNGELVDSYKKDLPRVKKYAKSTIKKNKEQSAGQDSKTTKESGE